MALPRWQENAERPWTNFRLYAERSWSWSSWAADELASESTVLTTVNSVHDVSIPLSSAKYLLILACLRSTNSRWQSETRWDVTRQIWPLFEINSIRSPPFKPEIYNNNNCSNFLALSYGHSRWKDGCSSNDFCRCFRVVEHYLRRCSLLNVVHYRFLGNFFLACRFQSWHQ